MTNGPKKAFGRILHVIWPQEGIWPATIDDTGNEKYNERQRYGKQTVSLAGRFIMRFG